MNIQAIPYVIITGLCFGSSLIASRFGLSQFDPIVYTGLRLFLASLAFLSIYWFGRRHHPWPTNRRLWQHGIVLGVIGTAVPTLGIILALQYLSSGLTSIMITTGPALTVVLAHYMLTDETLNRKKSIGIVLALAGAVLLALRGESGLPDIGQANPIGYVVLVIALIAISSAIIYTRKYLRGFSSIDVTSIQIFVATLLILPLSLIFIGLDLQEVNLQGYFALSYSALVGTFSAFLLFFYLIGRFGATSAAMTGYVNPVSASLGGVLILGERITAGMLMGMAIIVIGITIINQRQAVTKAA